MAKKRIETPLEALVKDIARAELRLRLEFPDALAAMREARDELVNARAMLTMEIAVLDNRIAETSRKVPPEAGRIGAVKDV
jgi:hypothetical protein